MITVRHLLEKTIATCRTAVAQHDGMGESHGSDRRCENKSVPLSQVKDLLEERGKFTPGFDGIGRQREATPTLLPAIARLGELVPSLTVLLIVTSPRPRFFHAVGVPHIQFPPYDRSESLTIVSRSPQPIFTDTETAEDDEWLWSRYCGAIWDALGKGAARDVVSLRSVCQRLWEAFVQPIKDGAYGTRDFSRLMVRNKVLFQSEWALVESLVPIDPLNPVNPVSTCEKFILSFA